MENKKDRSHIINIELELAIENGNECCQHPKKAKTKYQMHYHENEDVSYIYTCFPYLLIYFVICRQYGAVMFFLFYRLYQLIPIIGVYTTKV